MENCNPLKYLFGVLKENSFKKIVVTYFYILYVGLILVCYFYNFIIYFISIAVRSTVGNWDILKLNSSSKKAYPSPFQQLKHSLLCAVFWAPSCAYHIEL